MPRLIHAYLHKCPHIYCGRSVDLAVVSCATVFLQALEDHFVVRSGAPMIRKWRYINLQLQLCLLVLLSTAVHVFNYYAFVLLIL